MNIGMPMHVSMMRVFDSKVKQLEGYLALRLRAFDEVVSPWDAAVVDHSVLLTTARTVKEDMAQWKTCLLQLMASLWLEQKSSYNAYRAKVEKALQKRHRCELEALFSNLRYLGESKDAGAKQVSYTPKQVALKAHLSAAGYRYNPDDLMLQKVTKRQVAELATLEALVTKHLAFLSDSAERDAARLSSALNRALDTGDRILSLVEQKVSLSHLSSQTPNLYRKSLSKSQALRKASVPVPPQDVAAPAAPVGSALDRTGSIKHDADTRSGSQKDGESGQL